MSKWKRWFGTGRKCEARTSSPSCLLKLQETFDMLKKKEGVLRDKISIENERAKRFTKFKNKIFAMKCMERRAFYESQVRHIENLRLQVHDQMRKLEGVIGQALVIWLAINLNWGMLKKYSWRFMLCV